MPAASKASLIAIRVFVCPEGTPLMTSSRLIVALPIPEFVAKSCDDQRSKARAALI